MPQPIDAALLHAWLDNELGAEPRAEVDAWLRDNPQDAARVRLWAADRDALRARFDPVLTEPLPTRLLRPARAGVAPGLAPGWQRWAAAVLVFVMGGVAGSALMWRLQPGAPQRSAAAASPAAAWVQRAVLAHSVYVPEVRHAVEVKAQEEHLSRWLTRRLNVPVKLFDLRAQGFELVGGRLLPDAAAGPSAQLMYQAIAAPTADAAVNPMANTAASAAAPAAKPVRVTVYLRKPDNDAPASFRYEQQGELGMFYWVEGKSEHGGPCGYALVGALPRDTLLMLAEAIYRQDSATRP